MPHARYKTVIDAPFERVQDLLVDKMEKPKKYVGVIQSSTILERGDGFIIREMSEPSPSNLVTREKIYRRDVPGGEEFVYEQIGGKAYTGFFHNILTRVPDRDDQCELEYVMDWTPRDGGEDKISAAQAEKMVRQGVNHLKDMAENPPQVPDFVRDFYRSVDSLQANGMEPLLTDDVRFRIGSHSDIIGKDQVIKLNQQVMGQWKMIRHHFLGAYEDKGRTFVDCFVEYRMLDDREYMLPFLSMFERRDGKISSLKVFGDMSPLIHGWPSH
jgi:hypothetical protein